MNSAKRSAADLASEIMKHRRLYARGQPEISDEAYDELEAKLELLVPHHPLLQQVGYDDGKVSHPIPVLSLEKTRTFERVRLWARKAALSSRFAATSSSLSAAAVEVLCLYKLDGAFISLAYHGGQFVLAKTRGDGSRGEDVTTKIKHLPSLPLTIHTPSTLEGGYLEVRGELCCSLPSFAALAEEMRRKSLPPPTSRRNIVAGVLSRKDHQELARFFSFRAFDVVSTRLDEHHLFATETAKLSYLEANGFDVVPGIGALQRTFTFEVVDELELLYSEGRLQALVVLQGRRRISLAVTAWGPAAAGLGGIPTEIAASDVFSTDVRISGQWCVTDAAAWSQLQQELAVELGSPLAALAAQLQQGLLTEEQLQRLTTLWSFAAHGAVERKVQKRHGSRVPTELACLAWLEEQGFEVSSSYRAFCARLSGAQEYRRSPERSFDIDGLVLSYNNTAVHAAVGITAHHPHFRLSYKWQDTEVESVVREIHWEVSRNGTITPVVLIEPVDIGGVKVRRVTLYNRRSFEQWNPAPQDRVWVVRSGAVIPKITRLIKRPHSSSSSPTLPQVCPACGAPLNLHRSEVSLVCENSAGCPPQIAGRMDHWCQSVGIDDLSKKRIRLLMKHGLLEGIPDLYRLEQRKNELLQIPRMGVKMVEKLLRNIERSKSLSLLEVCLGLGIAGLQKATAQDLLKLRSSVEGLWDLSAEELAAVPGFAATSAATIVQGLAENRALIAELRELGVEIN